MGGFCLLIELAQPGLVVASQPTIGHAVMLVFDGRGYFVLRALSCDYVARLRPIALKELGKIHRFW